jgi:hypothetical protein
VSPARTAALVLIALTGAIALVGCGEDSGTDEQDYVAQAQEVAASFTKTAEELQARISELAANFNLKTAGNLLGTFADRVDDLAAEIDDIDPPAAVEGLHTQLVDLLENFASKAQQASLALKAGDLLGGLPALTNFATEATEISGKVDSTVDQIKGRLGAD